MNDEQEQQENKIDIEVVTETDDALYDFINDPEALDEEGCIKPDWIWTGDEDVLFTPEGADSFCVFSTPTKRLVVTIQETSQEEDEILITFAKTLKARTNAGYYTGSLYSGIEVDGVEEFDLSDREEGTENLGWIEYMRKYAKDNKCYLVAFRGGAGYGYSTWSVKIGNVKEGQPETSVSDTIPA